MDLLVNHPRYSELVCALDSGQAWRALAELRDEYCTLLSAADLAQAERRPSPAHYLLERISAVDQPLTVEETVQLLEALGGPAAEAAELIRPLMPLRVRPLAESNSAAVWVPPGGRLSLLCEAEARPPPTYLWRRDGVAVSAAAGGDRCQLCLEPFTAADAGRYSCEVSDAAGRSVLAGEVSVQPRQTPPRQTDLRVSGGCLSDGAVSATGDRPLSLTVDWVGWPEPEVRWERNGQTLAGADKQTLVLQPGPEMAEGTYVCVASNAVGETCSDPLLVKVDQRPMILRHPEPAQPSQPIGRPMKLTCSAYCARPLRVVWRRSLDGGPDAVLPDRQVTTETTSDGVVHSELRLTPAETEASQLCSVTCEFLAEGDFANSFSQSRPAKFRVTYSAYSKMALIIGNCKYQHLIQLDKVKQDVADFQSAIRQMGFGALVAMNLTTERSRRAVEYFARVAAPGAYLVVLVAGHGFAYQREDYLAPVDHPPLENGGAVHPNSCLSMLRDIEDRLQRTSPKLLLICLDACRTMSELSVAAAATSAAASAAELSPRAAPNVLRLYSTQMGHQAMDDSHFMRCLLQNIQSDITVQELGLKTLKDVYGTSLIADQVQQYPMMEVSIPSLCSLRDPAEHTSALDEHVDQSFMLENVNFRLEMRWSNYVWDATPELLLTLRLCNAPQGYYVYNVLPVSNVLPFPKDMPGLRFSVESGSAFSPVSSWRLLGLPPAAGQVLLQPIVKIAHLQVPGRCMAFQPGGVSLRLHQRYGLYGPQAPAAASQGKVSNLDSAAHSHAGEG